MSTVSVVGGRCLTASGLEALTLTYHGDTITALSSPDSAGSASPQNDPVTAAIDASGLVVCPGLIDLQVNGGFGHDLQTNPEAVWDLGRELPRTGVTAFLPTVITGPPSTRRAMQEALRARPARYLGAEPLGAHFEGPMLNPHHAGVHPPEHLTVACEEVIDGWHRSTGVAMVTIAPELAGASDIIRELTRRGIAVAAGHSAATAHDMPQAIAAGLSTVTHLFNAMAPFGHRHPNLAGVALAEPRLVATLIVDGAHLDPVAVAAAWNAKRPDGIAVVTDAVAAMGQPPGEYWLCGQPTFSDGASVRTAQGGLAGSITSMNQAVANLEGFTACARHSALAAATSVPAETIREKRRGRLDPGSTADLVLLDDDYRVHVTICEGQVVYVDAGSRCRLSGSPERGW